MHSYTPVLLVHGDTEHIERLVIVVSKDHLAASAQRDHAVAMEMGKRLACRHVVYVGAPIDGFQNAPESKASGQTVEHIASDDPLGWGRDNAVRGKDLVARNVARRRERIDYGVFGGVVPK